MNDLLALSSAWIAGFFLGVLFFGGLGWTVRRGVTAKQPAFWFLGSSLLRMGVTLLGFYFVSGGHWQRLLSCLVGFVVARIIVIELTKKRAFAPQS